MKKPFIHPDVLRTVLGFESRYDLTNNCQFVSKQWQKMIDRGGKGLDQLQALKMRTSYPYSNTYWVEFSNGEKTIRIIKEQEMKGAAVLKNNIVKQVETTNYYDLFEQFKRITMVVGQKIPIARFCYKANDQIQDLDDQIQDLLHFREHYSSKNSCLKVKCSVFRVLFILDHRFG